MIAQIVLLVIGAVLALILTVLFSDPLASLVARLLGPFSSLSTGRTIKGQWFSYYEVVLDGEIPRLPGMPIDTDRIEGVVFTKVGSAVIGKNTRDSRAYFLRLRMEDNCVLTGTWRDQSDNRHHFGAVQLVWDYSGGYMMGKYVGRDRHHDVNWGPWIFARNESQLQSVVDDWRKRFARSPADPSTQTDL